MLVRQAATIYVKKCEEGSGDTAIPNKFFTPPLAGDSSKVMNITRASSSKDELAKGQPWTAVEIAECLRP